MLISLSSRSAMRLSTPPLISSSRRSRKSRKREPQIILKTDERKIHLERGLEGKFAAKSTGWDENRVFLEGNRLEVSVKSGRWVLCHE
jgi:hypothetical protein